VRGARDVTAADGVLDALRAHGCDPRQNGSGWSARCPAHDDRHPSLSLSEGRDDSAVLHCHTGCSQDAVVAALDLNMSDLFPKDERATGGRRILETYDYTDEDGTLIHQTVRYKPRGFSQRRPDGNGGWEWNLNGVRRVLYRLPDVLDAVGNGADIFVCEGEKDADAVVRAGEVGTTNPMGAEKWRPEYADMLAGAAMVFVVADRDGPGYRHAAMVAASLEGRVGNVTVVEPVEGNDLTDHLAAGYTLNDLAVAANLDERHDQEWPQPGDREPAAQRPALRVVPVRQTLATPPPEPEPLAAGLVNKGELVVLGAGRAWNKSLFVAQLGWKLAEGDGLFLRDFLIKRRCRVGIAQGEVTPYQSWIRWHLLSGGEGAPEGLGEIFLPWKIRTIRKRRRDPIEDCYEEWPEAVLDPRLEQAVADDRLDILFIDPWATYFSGAENSNDEVEAALDQLRNLSVRYGVAIWINHHFSQRGMTDKIDPEDAWRGASRLADWATTRITLLPHYTPKRIQKLKLTRAEARRYLDVRFLTRGAPIDDFSLHRRDDLWLERWEDTDTEDVTDHVAELIDPVVEVVTKAAEQHRVDLAKADLANGLRAARITFDDNDLIPAVLVAAQRGQLRADKPNPQRWRINLPEAVQ
jgi:hypothetical protein